MIARKPEEKRASGTVEVFFTTVWFREPKPRESVADRVNRATSV